MVLSALAITAAISLEIDLGALLRRYEDRSPRVVCGITTVGYRIQGPVGSEFVYAGRTFTIPAKGYVEVIAERRYRDVRFAGRLISLEPAGPRDAFGFLTVVLTKAR